MSSLLERLSTATNYKDLQEIFGELAAQAKAGGENPELARTIDEAVRRLEQERARDEQEMADIQSRYDNFKSDNKGVVGWFKRHVPFTETRKQEVGHREELGDQQAEILADNLVIARAQMIKERILGSGQRRLGLRPLDWQMQLAQHESVEGLTACATLFKRLTEEAGQSTAFVQELKRDIDAFAGADFKSKDDRQRRDADYAAACQELGVLEKELDEEKKLRKSGLKRLADTVATELAGKDATFRDDGVRLERFVELLVRLDESRSGATKLVAAVGGVSGLLKELTDLPNETRKVREALQKAESHRGLADTHRDKSATLTDRQTRHEEALRNLEQKQQLLAGAEQFHQAYVAEQQAKQAAGLPVEVESPDSPVIRCFHEAQAAVHAAQSLVRETQAPMERARQEAAEARAALDAANKEIETLRQKLATLEQRAPQIRLELNRASEGTRGACDAAASAFAAYLASARAMNPPVPFRPEELAAGPYGWLGPHGLERSFSETLMHAERDPQRHGLAVGLLDRLAKWLEAQHAKLDQERKTMHDRRTALWQRRCRELLGDDLASEACAGGLATGGLAAGAAKAK